MKIKVMKKMIAVMCAASISALCMATSVGAAGFDLNQLKISRACDLRKTKTGGQLQGCVDVAKRKEFGPDKLKVQSNVVGPKGFENLQIERVASFSIFGEKKSETSPVVENKSEREVLVVQRPESGVNNGGMPATVGPVSGFKGVNNSRNQKNDGTGGSSNSGSSVESPVSSDNESANSAPSGNSNRKIRRARTGGSGSGGDGSNGGRGSVASGSGSSNSESASEVLKKIKARPSKELKESLINGLKRSNSSSRLYGEKDDAEQEQENIKRLKGELSCEKSRVDKKNNSSVSSKDASKVKKSEKRIIGIEKHKMKEKIEKLQACVRGMLFRKKFEKLKAKEDYSKLVDKYGVDGAFEELRKQRANRLNEIQFVDEIELLGEEKPENVFEQVDEIEFLGKEKRKRKNNKAKRVKKLKKLIKRSESESENDSDSEVSERVKRKNNKAKCVKKQKKNHKKK